MRICLDENVPDHVKTRLEARGHDVTFAREITDLGTPDEKLLQLCAQERRVLLTNDRDFDKLHETHHHEGILRYSVKQTTKQGWQEIVRGISLIEDYMFMRNELQWPVEWWRRFKE